ncbi:MAG: DUF222 domain-containing protein, partial [Candidatus Dormibacteria bacterium]
MYEEVDGPTASPPLIALRDAVARYCAELQPSADGEQVRGELQVTRWMINQLELGFAKHAAALAGMKESEFCGALSAVAWIRHTCHMSGAAASSAVCAGERLSAIPETERAMEAGEIGFSHLAMLASAERAADAATGDAAAFDERPLLALAREHSVSRFYFDCAAARAAADAAGFLTDHLSAVEWRSLELTPCENGVLVRGRLDPVGAATVRAALEPLAKREGAGDERPRSRRMAEAWIELSHHGLDAGVLPSIAGQRPHLQVTASVETLQGGRGAPTGEVEYAGPVPHATVERLACDAAVTRVVFGPGSVILDAGRSRRLPGAAMRRALVARDQGCRWPGCDRPSSWTAAHHLRHWAGEGGTTDVANLVSICHKHHEKVHEHGWR